jgi:dipeptidyl aminopeptidase/acylaminoacyl peptidase
VHNYVGPSERSPYNAAVFTANGYFVLQPDIVFRPRDPGIAALDCVTAAVKAALATGMVDPKRVGLVGHSWGGYEASFIPTQTNLFAASVAGAPITNLLSFYGAIHWGPGLPEPAHFETGQARMDVPFWVDLPAYLRNSPTLFVDKLKTPMLIFFGDKDGTVDFRQGVEMYNYARRAGKQLVMLVYANEDHSAREKPNQIDYHRRILQWFGHYLKGEDAPAWITKGVTVIDSERASKTR